MVDLYELLVYGLAKGYWSAHSDDDHTFQHADSMCKTAILDVLGNTIVDAYLMLPTNKEMWDALEVKYGVSDTDSELWSITVL